MGSVGVCGALSLYMLLKYSWRSFKLLKSQTPPKDWSVSQSASRGETLSFKDGVAKGTLDTEGAVQHSSSKLELPLGMEERKVELVYLLQFWTIYAVLTLYEYYLEFIVALVPFYYSVKFVFLLYINVQQTRGVAVIFEGIVQPYIVRAERFFRQVLIPPLIVLPKAIEDAVLPCLSLYRVEATIEYLEELVAKLKEERERRLVTIDLSAAAKVLPESSGDSSTTEPGKEVKVSVGKEGQVFSSPSDDIAVLTEQEQIALEPIGQWKWRSTLPNMMNSVIGLTVQTKELFVSGKHAVSDSVTFDTSSVTSESNQQPATQLADHTPSTPLRQHVHKQKRKVSRRFSMSSTSSSDSSGDSSGEIPKYTLDFCIT